jgi:hypothetical protein
METYSIYIIFYFIYCVCANYKCCIMPSRGPDLENKVPGILNLVSCIYIIFQFKWFSCYQQYNILFSYFSLSEVKFF